jgi:hypothetical protein
MKQKSSQEEAKRKGDSGQAASRETGQKQAAGASACCLGTLDQPPSERKQL